MINTPKSESGINQQNIIEEMEVLSNYQSVSDNDFKMNDIRSERKPSKFLKKI